MKKHIYTYLVLLWIILFSVGCASQEPVMVFVTPTPPEITPSENVPTETSTYTASPTAAATLPPTVMITDEAGGQTVPSMTPLGSVLEPGYTLPPTSTPRPSATPTASPTVSLSETPLPVVTEPAQTPATPIPPVGALPNLDPLRMGIQLDPTLNQEDWNNALGTIQNLGVRWLKVQVSWRQLQPNGPDEVSEDFRRLEIYLETAYNNGLDILISVAKAPDWARSRSNRNEDGPPDDPAALAQFIDLMLSEFGTSLDAIEVWNEPNLSREWQGTLSFDGAGYMQLFRPAYDTITTYAQSMVNDPQVPRTTPLYIITAGLAPTSDNAELGSRNDRSFLQEMYAAGLGDYSDIFIGLHPYGWWNPPDARCCGNSERGWDNDPHFYFLDNVSEMRDIMVANGHTEQRMFVTEFGYATWEYLPTEAPQAWMNYVSECQQGEYIVRAFELAQSWDYMGPMILWNLNVANPVTVQNRDEMAAYSMLVPLEPRERAAYWMIFDTVRPDIPGLESYSRCPGVTP